MEMGIISSRSDTLSSLVGYEIRTTGMKGPEESPICNISNKSDSVSSGYPNTEKRVKNTTHSGVF